MRCIWIISHKHEHGNQSDGQLAPALMSVNPAVCRDELTAEGVDAVHSAGSAIRTMHRGKCSGACAVGISFI